MTAALQSNAETGWAVPTPVDGPSTQTALHFQTILTMGHRSQNVIRRRPPFSFLRRLLSGAKKRAKALVVHTKTWSDLKIAEIHREPLSILTVLGGCAGGSGQLVSCSQTRPAIEHGRTRTRLGAYVP